MPTIVAIGDIEISQRDLDRLWSGIEEHLANAAPPAPAKPGIVHASVADLIEQARIQKGPAWRQKKPRTKQRKPEIDLPGRLRAMIPEPLHRRRSTYVTVARHLELTLEVLERYGWARTGDNWRTVGGRRCILGAQMLLLALGYGDRDTLNRAGGYLNVELRQRRVTNPYYEWNEAPGRTYDDVRHLLGSTIDKARKAGH
jgi:hypothetical protein